MLRGLGPWAAALQPPQPCQPCQPPWCWESIYFSPVHICPLIECESGLYLYLGRCESNCPPRTYPGINSKERAACMPCHYTCLTCAGESEGECTSCHDEAVPTPSGLKDAKGPKASNGFVEVESLKEGPKSDVKVEDLSTSVDEGVHLSWGKRQAPPLVSRSVLRKKAVTKKILEPYDAPRTLFFCYPSSLVNQMKATEWYRRMALLFAANLLLLFFILLYFAWNRFQWRKRDRLDSDNIRYRYSKMNSNGSSVNSGNLENILYLSSSSDEE